MNAPLNASLLTNPQLIAGEEPGTYRVDGDVTDAQLLHLAKMIAQKRLSKGNKLGSPDEVHRCLQTLLLDYPYEVFGTLLLDTQHRLITFDELFRGTIDSASVYPREVIKHAIENNAAAVILVHNHPGVEPERSAADRRFTHRVM